MPVGQSTLTTLQTHVRLPNHGDSARGPAIVAFDLAPRSAHRLPEVDDQSRSVGPRCSSVHDEGWVSHPPMDQQLSPCQRQGVAASWSYRPVSLPTGRTVHEVEAVCHLPRLRRTTAGSVGIEARPITGDHL